MDTGQSLSMCDSMRLVGIALGTSTWCPKTPLNSPQQSSVFLDLFGHGML